jgi:hypothetical protein
MGPVRGPSKYCKSLVFYYKMKGSLSAERLSFPQKGLHSLEIVRFLVNTSMIRNVVQLLVTKHVVK